MPFRDDPQHWRDRAAQMRVLASQMNDLDDGDHAPARRRLRRARRSRREAARTETRPSRTVPGRPLDAAAPGPRGLPVRVPDAADRSRLNPVHRPRQAALQRGNLPLFMKLTE